MSCEVNELRGQWVNEKRVARVMREHGLQSHKRRRRFVVATDSKHACPIAPNVLKRDFEASAPNQKWLADTTCVATDEGWLYVALVRDLHARKLVGWAMSETMPQALTHRALDVALGWRDPAPGRVHHSDRGSQHAAGDYRKKLAARGITVSMSRKGDCWDNAPMESGNGTLKIECVHGEHFATRAQAADAIVEYIGYHSTERRHSALGNLAPAEFERRWGAGIEPEEQVASRAGHRVTHRRPVPGSSQATEPAVRGQRSSCFVASIEMGTGAPNGSCVPPASRRKTCCPLT